MRVTTWAAALLCGMALALQAVAQEDVIPKAPPADPSTPPAETPATDEAVPPPTPKKPVDFGDPPLHRWGGMTVFVAAWEPDLLAADEELAQTFLNGTGSPIMQGSTPHIRETVGASYHLPNNVGSIGITYDSMDQTDSVAHLSPGQFIFGETRAFPVALGAFNDGFADGVTASLSRKTRDFRLFYTQTAFENPRVKGTWGAGYQQVTHTRNIAISYLAIVPNLPPLIPGAGDNATAARLAPIPDQVAQTANFSGHGLGVTLDLNFVIVPRVSIITGLAIGLIRGSASSAYASQSSDYVFRAANGEVVILTKDELFAILNAGEADDIARVGQELVHVGLQQSPTSQMAEVFNIYLGLEVNVYKGLKVYGTLRDVYYANVGEYVVPTPNFNDTRTPLNAGYEGYVLGLSWRF